MQQFVGKQIDRYRILEQQGIGGMAVVYKAFDTRLGRDVAIKFIRVDAIPAEQHERLMIRFDREAKAQAQFTHPNIVPVYDYGDVDGFPYLVMEFIPNGTLKDKLGQSIHYHQVLQWLAPIADALAYAHQEGIIHRDVKPSNILFNKLGRPILTDFGIAKVLETTESTLTGTGLGVGTPEYMAPEQWKGKATTASDQYALGVVLYEALTGHKPFTAETPVAVALKQMSEPLRRPSEWVPDIPEGVERALFKAMALNPEDRYESMAAFHQVLSKLSTTLDAVPVGVRPQPTPPKVKPPAVTPPIPIDSEGETVDVLDRRPPTISGQVREESPVAAWEKQSAFPKWVMWAGLGIFGIVLVGLLIAWLMGDSGLLEPKPEPLSAMDIGETIAALAKTEMGSDSDQPETLSPVVQASPTDKPVIAVIPSSTSTQPLVSTSTDAPEPTATKTVNPNTSPTVFITPTPKTYTPLSGCPASQLHVGDSAFISYEGGRNSLRSDTDTTGVDNIFTYIQPGEVVEIIGGPACDWPYLLWEVRTTRDETGWSAETKGESFWMLPLATRELCKDALPTRLILGQRVKVMEEPPDRNILRTMPIRGAEEVDRVRPGHWMLIVGGPVCGEGTTWWQVKSEDTGKVGWTMEGNLEEYWLAPEP